MRGSLTHSDRYVKGFHMYVNIRTDTQYHFRSELEINRFRINSNSSYRMYEPEHSGEKIWSKFVLSACSRGMWPVSYF